MNILSIDVEEHFQVHNFETVVNRLDWDSYQSRVIENTHRIMRLLSKHNVYATFFILGWVADRYPFLVREIADRGHEIASHGYWHKLIYNQTPDEFANDLELSLKVITAALNCLKPEPKIIGYRAPSFSITRQSLWALDILPKYGIRYDSSIFPIMGHDRYGISSARRFAFKVKKDLWEFPVSTTRFFGKNWPVAGGGYFRLFPLQFTRRAIRQINYEGHPAIVYLHPWKFDPEQPRIPNVPLLSRFRHYCNLHKTENRLDMLLQEFEFGPICKVFDSQLEVA